jgi:hypothetical protein
MHVRSTAKWKCSVFVDFRGEQQNRWLWALSANVFHVILAHPHSSWTVTVADLVGIQTLSEATRLQWGRQLLEQSDTSTVLPPTMTTCQTTKALSLHLPVSPSLSSLVVVKRLINNQPRCLYNKAVVVVTLDVMIVSATNRNPHQTGKNLHAGKLLQQNKAWGKP